MQRSWLQVAGLERSAGDVYLPSLLFATAVPAPMACGDVLAIDVQAAERHPGVVCVLTAESLLAESARPFASLLRQLLSPTVTQAGQTIALVVAETRQAAHAAAAKVDARVRAQSAHFSIASALASGRIAAALKRSVEQPAEAFVQAKTRFLQTYRTAPRPAGGAADGVATAVWRDGGLTLFTVGRPAPNLGDQLGLRPEQLLVVSSSVGSDRLVQGPQIALAAIAAAQLQRPVRVFASSLSASGVIAETVQTVQLALGESGRPSALLLRGAVGTSLPLDASVVEEVMTLAKLYGFAAREVHVVSASVHLPAGGGHARAIGPSDGLSLTFGLESAIDELAVQQGADPIAVRLGWLDGNETLEAKLLRGCLLSLQQLRAKHVGSQPTIWRAGVSSAIHRLPSGQLLLGAHLVLAGQDADQALQLCHFFSLAGGNLEASAGTNATVLRSLERARRLAMRSAIKTLPRAGWICLHSDDAAAEPALVSCAVSFVQVTGDNSSTVDAESVAQLAATGVDAAVLGALSAAMSEHSRQLPVAWRAGRVVPS